MHPCLFFLHLCQGAIANRTRGTLYYSCFYVNLSILGSHRDGWAPTPLNLERHQTLTRCAKYNVSQLEAGNGQLFVSSLSPLFDFRRRWNICRLYTGICIVLHPKSVSVSNGLALVSVKGPRMGSLEEARQRHAGNRKRSTTTAPHYSFTLLTQHTHGRIMQKIISLFA